MHLTITLAVCSTLSMKALRKLLEEDLKVPRDTLKSFKQEIEYRALKVLLWTSVECTLQQQELCADFCIRYEVKPS